MDAEAILHELTQAEGLPRKALEAASARRVEMLPLFLAEIEAYLALALLHFPPPRGVARKGRL